MNISDTKRSLESIETKLVELLGHKILHLSGKRYVSIEDLQSLVMQKKMEISFGPNTPPDPGSTEEGETP